MAVRVWPASDYTRVTLEMDQPLRFSQTLIGDPSRLVVDLEGLDVDEGLRDRRPRCGPMIRTSARCGSAASGRR